MDENTAVALSNAGVCLIVLLVISLIFKGCQYNHEERMYKLQHPTGETTQHDKDPTK